MSIIVIFLCKKRWIYILFSYDKLQDHFDKNKLQDHFHKTKLQDRFSMTNQETILV